MDLEIHMLSSMIRSGLGLHKLEDTPEEVQSIQAKEGLCPTKKNGRGVPYKIVVLVRTVLEWAAGVKGGWVRLDEFDTLFRRVKKEPFRVWTLERFGVTTLHEFFVKCPRNLIEMRDGVDGIPEVRATTLRGISKELPLRLVSLVRNILLREHTAVGGMQWVPVSHFQRVFQMYHVSGRPFAVETLRRFGVYRLQDFFQRCPATSVRIRVVCGEMMVQGVGDKPPAQEVSCKTCLPLTLVRLVRAVLQSREARDPDTGCLQWIPVNRLQRLFQRCRRGDVFRFDALRRFGVSTAMEFFAKCPSHMIKHRVIGGSMQVLAVPDPEGLA